MQAPKETGCLDMLWTLLVVGILASLVACDTSSSPEDVDDASDPSDAEDAAADATESDDASEQKDAEGPGEPSEDGSQPSVDDGGVPDGSSPMDASSVVLDTGAPVTDDAGSGSEGGGNGMEAGSGGEDAQVGQGDAQTSDASEPISYVCHTSAANGVFPSSVVLASGIGSPYAIRGNRLLTGQDNGDNQHFRTVGKWALWSLTNSELIQDPSVSTNDPLTVYDVGTSVFLTSSSPVGGAELHSLEDGHLLWSSPCAGGGMSPSGSYAWLKCGIGQTDPNSPVIMQLAARTAEGTTWLDVTRNASDTAIATDNALIAVRTNSTDTTLTVYPRAGGSPTTVGPLAGRLLGVFEDRGHIVTLAASDLIRVYALDGTRKVLMTGTGDYAGGRGGVFWLASQTDNEISFFKNEAAATRLGGTSLGRVDFLHNGLGITHSNQQGERVVFSGSNIDVQTISAEPGVKLNATASSADHFAYGIGDTPPLAGSYGVFGMSPDPLVVSATVVDNSPVRLGCGNIQSTAMSGSRLFVGTKNAGIFVYEPPYQTPIRQLPLIALDIRVAHLTGRFAVLTRDRVRVFNPDFSVARDDIDLSFINSTRDNMQIDLSPDGSLLSYSYHQLMGSTRVNRVIRVSSSEVVYENIFSDLGPTSIAFPVVVSPSGHRFVDNVGQSSARIYEDGVLTGTFNGVATAWIDDNRIAAFFQSLRNPGFDSGERLVSYEGIQLGTFECVPRAMPSQFMGVTFQAWSDQLQWVDGNTIYAVGGNIDVCSGCQCELPAGTVQEVAPGASPAFWATPGFGVYPGGSFFSGAGSVTKKAGP